jgi:CMP-N,N'-diacetyllegionaminic acid synthase
VIIPARGGSVGIKDKNIKLFSGSPLISYSINVAKQVAALNKIIVSTDSNDIASLAQQYGADIPFMRPESLSGAIVSIEEVLIHAFEMLEEEQYTADAIILLFPTSPLRNSEQISQCIDLFYASNADCVFTVNESPAHYSPYWTIVTDGDNLMYFDGSSLGSGYSRRQDFPKQCFAKNDLVFVVKPSSLLKNKSIFGHLNKMIITDPVYGCDINEIQDWKVCEALYHSLYGNN